MTTTLSIKVALIKFLSAYLELQTMTSFYAGGLSQWKFAVRGTPKFFHQIQNLTITS